MNERDTEFLKNLAGIIGNIPALEKDDMGHRLFMAVTREYFAAVYGLVKK